MKKINSTVVTIILIISIFTFSSCEKKSNLPVHDPGRIVTCKIDGVPWSHGTEWCPSCHSLETDYYSGRNELFIRVLNFL